MIQHLAAEAADRSLFDRDHDLVLPSEACDKAGMEPLRKARIGNRRRQPVSRELLGGLHAFGEAAAEIQQRDSGALADDAAAADLERDAPLGQRYADPVAARIAHRRRRVVY